MVMTNHDLITNFSNILIAGIGYNTFRVIIVFLFDYFTGFFYRCFIIFTQRYILKTFLIIL